jgi:hypothetical protein
MIEQGGLHLVCDMEDSAHLTVVMINFGWPWDRIRNFHAASPYKPRLSRNLLIYPPEEPDHLGGEEAFAGKN